MRLVEDWRKAWKWFSVQSMALAITVQGAWASIPDDMKASIPAYLVTGVSMGLLVLGIAGRLVKQGPDNPS